MIISAVHLYNFKSFKGLHKIEGLDDNLSSKNNIVLIGGLNGAGKTSFLEAFFLCFYGNGAKNLYPTRGAKHENYQGFVNSLLNNDEKNETYSSGILGKDIEMYVKVFLKDVPLTGNFPKNVCLKRTWRFTLMSTSSEVSFKESFEILENDSPLEGLEVKEYQDTIDGLLPYDVSQLFLFDGEKIQDFAGDPVNEFSNALRTVLGIQIYSTLIDDLKTVRSRILTEYNQNKGATAFLAEKQAEKVKKQALIEDNRIEISSINNSLDGLEIELEKSQNETYRVTRIQTGDRSGFEKQKQLLEEEKASLEQQYIDKSTDLLPFLLAADLFKEVDSQLIDEEKLSTWQAAQQEIEPKIDSIINYVFKSSSDIPKPEISSTHKRYYGLRIDEAIKQIIFQAKNDELENLQIIHGLSSSESQKVRGFFQSIDQAVVDELEVKSTRLKDIDYTLSKIRSTQIQAGESSDEIKRLFDKQNHLAQSIGSLKERKNTLDFQNLELKREIEAINSQITKWGDRANLNDDQRKRMAYCEKLQTVIQDFQKQFQAKRTENLESAILDMWNTLAHKDRLVRKVQVLSDNNFAVELFDASGNKLDKTKLSAGEKEIYAIALLWALVQVSGRVMPIIIDTPFGRLDSLHRGNLVRRYFPKASHQVILLSQDEEIVDEYYDQIKPYIAKELTIEYVNGESFVREGYPFTQHEVV